MCVCICPCLLFIDCTLFITCTSFVAVCMLMLTPALVGGRCINCIHRSIYKYLDTGLLSLNVAIGDPFKLTSPDALTHAPQPNLSSALLVLPAGRMPR